MTEAFVIRRDGEVKHIELGEYFEVAGWMHRHTSCSIHHATQYEGWSIAEERVVANLSDAAFEIEFVIAPGMDVVMDDAGYHGERPALTGLPLHQGPARRPGGEG